MTTESCIFFLSEYQLPAIFSCVIQPASHPERSEGILLFFSLQKLKSFHAMPHQDFDRRPERARNFAFNFAAPSAPSCWVRNGPPSIWAVFLVAGHH